MARPAAAATRVTEAVPGSPLSLSYEGGQMPLFRRMPKRGFNNANFDQVRNRQCLSARQAFGDGTTVGIEELLRRRPGGQPSEQGQDSRRRRADQEAECVGSQVQQECRAEDFRLRRNREGGRLITEDREGTTMLGTFVNIFKIPDLRNKILFTIASVVIYRIGFHIPVPGFDESTDHSGRSEPRYGIAAGPCCRIPADVHRRHVETKQSVRPGDYAVYFGVDYSDAAG